MSELPATAEQAWSIEGAEYALEQTVSAYRRRTRLDELVVEALERDARQTYMARGQTSRERVQSVIEELGRKLGRVGRTVSKQDSGVVSDGDMSGCGPEGPGSNPGPLTEPGEYRSSSPPAGGIAPGAGDSDDAVADVVAAGDSATPQAHPAEPGPRLGIVAIPGNFAEESTVEESLGL